MKKLALLFIGFVIVLSSCKKDDNKDDDSGPNPTNKQYALVLEQTGTWCGACPGAATILHSLVSTYGADMIPIAVHGANGDPMEISCFSSFRNDRNSSSFPSFFVPNERVSTSEGVVTTEIEKQLATPVVAGVDFVATISGGKLNVDAMVRFFTASSETFYLSIYVLESHIDGGPSAGAYAQTSGGSDYKHDHVLRECNTGSNFWGESLNITPVTSGQEFSLSYSFDVNPEWNTDNINVACVIWQYNASGAPVSYLFVNAKDDK